MRARAFPADGPRQRNPAFRYALLSPLGAGGMGIVHSALDTHTGRLVAIKRPWSLDPANQELGFEPRASILREGAALSRLAHPNVIRLWDHGADESGEPFLVLELLDRPGSIVSWAASASSAARVDALVQMFDALAHVHHARIAHGDINPSNVLVCEDLASQGAYPVPLPRVCVADFGLATDCDAPPSSCDRDATPPPSLAGSVLYLAPERMDGAIASPVSDIYAAGIIAAEVLTGANPRSRMGPRTTLSALRDFGVAWLDHLAIHFDLDRSATALLRSVLSRDCSARCTAEEAASCLRTISIRTPGPSRAVNTEADDDAAPGPALRNIAV
jgi:serine/threonine protein kinase